MHELWCFGDEMLGVLHFIFGGRSSTGRIRLELRGTRYFLFIQSGSRPADIVQPLPNKSSITTTGVVSRPLSPAAIYHTVSIFLQSILCAICYHHFSTTCFPRLHLNLLRTKIRYLIEIWAFLQMLHAGIQCPEP
jgi:hypothetical protein